MAETDIGFNHYKVETDIGNSHIMAETGIGFNQYAVETEDQMRREFIMARCVRGMGAPSRAYFAEVNASAFTQFSGFLPSTTSMAFCVARVRSSMADSSDQ